MSNKLKLIPIFTSRGDVGAFLVYPYIFNRQGEWIGWVTSDRDVYSVHGHHVGTLTKEPRILRKREWLYEQPRRQPPKIPNSIRPPANLPLAPLLPVLGMNTLDVLEEASELLPPIDFGEFRDDLD